MEINNEFDMFQVLSEKAKRKEIDHEVKAEFEQGIDMLKEVLGFVKMNKTENGFTIEKGFEIIKVTVEEYDDGNMVALSYEKVDGFKEHRDKIISNPGMTAEDLKAAHTAAVRKFLLW